MQQAGLYVTLDAHHAAVYTTATCGTGSWHPPYSCPCLSMLLTLGWGLQPTLQHSCLGLPSVTQAQSLRHFSSCSHSSAMCRPDRGGPVHYRLRGMQLPVHVAALAPALQVQGASLRVESSKALTSKRLPLAAEGSLQLSALSL